MYLIFLKLVFGNVNVYVRECMFFRYIDVLRIDLVIGFKQNYLIRSFFCNSEYS